MARQREGMTEAEYARHLGISQPAVNQAKRAGKIITHPDGSIDQERSDERYFGETDLMQSERGRSAPGPGEVGPRAGHAMQYMRAKTMQHMVQAQVGREKLARMRGEVVDRGEAQRIVFAMAREERDGWLTWPTRVAAQLATELAPPGSPPLNIHTVQVALERHVHAQLSAMPPLTPDPFPLPAETEFSNEENEDN